MLIKNPGNVIEEEEEEEGGEEEKDGEDDNGQRGWSTLDYAGLWERKNATKHT